MPSRRCPLFFLIGLFFLSRPVAAQLVTDLGSYHNQLFIGSGYTESFANITYGINHQRYFRSLKRNIVGILDFISPLSDKYFTRFIFRKGFQLDAYKKDQFRVPMALVTSSVKRELILFSFHDIITDLYILPGLYKPNYTIAADLSLQVLLFRSLHHHPKISDPSLKATRENVSLGIILARNINHFSFIFRGGFQQITDWEFTKAPVYAIGTVAFRLNFKKHKTDSVK